MTGGIKTREYYLACRHDNGIVRSLIETSKYKGMSIREVMDNLRMEPTPEIERKLKEEGYSL